MPSLQPSHAPEVKPPGSKVGNRLSLAVAKLDTLIHRIRHLGELANPPCPPGDQHPPSPWEAVTSVSPNQEN
jgi:hypothetical protein